MHIKRKLFLFSFFLTLSCSIDNFLEEAISISKKNTNNIQSPSISNSNIVYVDCFNFDNKTTFETIEEALKQNVSNIFVVQNTNYYLMLENVNKKSIDFNQTFMGNIILSNCFEIEIKNVNVLFDIQIFNSTNIVLNNVIADLTFMFKTKTSIKNSELENKNNLFVYSTMNVEKSSFLGIAIFTTIINSGNTNFYTNELVSF